MKPIKMLSCMCVTVTVIFLTELSWAELLTNKNASLQEEKEDVPLTQVQEVAVEKEDSQPAQVQEVVVEEAPVPKKSASPVKLHGERLAMAQEDQGKYDKAWFTWKEVIERENDQGTMVRYAQFLKRIGETDVAILVVREILQDYPPRNPSLLYWIADAYAEQGTFKEARQQLREINIPFPQEAVEIQRRLAHLDRMEVKAIAEKSVGKN